MVRPCPEAVSHYRFHVDISRMLPSVSTISPWAEVD
jgi:hypothetical protein